MAEPLPIEPSPADRPNDFAAAPPGGPARIRRQLREAIVRSDTGSMSSSTGPGADNQNGPRIDIGGDRLDLLPSRLAQACRDVLAVDGAGLSVFSDDFRVPLGASDHIASDAERLQFTHGEGPCMKAAEGGPVRAGPQYFETNWPLLYTDLLRRTPYRSVVTVPLPRMTPARGGALDLYSKDPQWARSMDLTPAMAVADQVISILGEADPAIETEDDGQLPGPAWLHGEAAHRRMQVWVAVGMLNVALDRPEDDVLALLRAYAYAHDRTVDDVAEAIVERQLPVLMLAP